MTGDAPKSNLPPTRPHPIRRVLLLLLVLLVLVPVVRLLWGWQTRRALDAQYAEIRRRGEPLVIDDYYVIDTLPDAQNAAAIQMKAAGAMVPTIETPRGSNLSFQDYPPYSDKWMAMNRASEQAHGKLFVLAREARRHQQVQWPQPPQRTAIAKSTALVGSLNAVRGLAIILADGALYAHATGDDVEAVERVRDLLHLSRSVRHEETIIAQLVAIGLDAVACHVTEIMAPGLRLDGSSSAAAAADAAAATAPATRAAAQALIEQLLDESSMRHGFERCFMFERVYTREARQGDAKGTWLIRPLADAQLLRDNRNIDVQIAASRLPNKPRAMAMLRSATPEEPYSAPVVAVAGMKNVPRYSRFFGESPLRMERFFETRFRVIGERRMAATSLAAQLFRADHGRWPQRLEELVPRYLPSAPLDPFADGEPIGYQLRRAALPDGGDRPLVFMRAGEADLGPYPQPSYGWETDRRTRVLRAQEPRQYRDLSRFVPPPPPPPSTQAVEDEPEESEPPGNAAEQQGQTDQPQPQ